MLPRSLLLCVFFLLPATSASYTNDGFTYNGFSSSMLRLDGVASITSKALKLTDGTYKGVGRAFYGGRLNSISSFSTTFVFVITSGPYSDSSGYGLAFTLSATTDSLLDTLPSQYLGMFNNENLGNTTNQLFAIELDTLFNREFRDIDSNHVGIDVNNLLSINSHTAGYYTSDGKFTTLRLISGEPMQVWVDYDANSRHVNVSLAPYLEPKPERPLLSSIVNLTSVLPRSVYVGFASATRLWSIHQIIGWSFNPNGAATPLDYSVLSEVIDDVRREAESQSDTSSHILLPIIIMSVFIVLVMLIALYIYMKKARKSGEWEIDCGSPSFTYKDLVTATNGFKNRMLLGKGGFGKVYKGTLQTSKKNVAIKRISPDSKQGMKEFIAEITILGHLRHRNLVQLLGYCRHKNELLIVYDYMPNGSLDRVLHGQGNRTIDWIHRFNIIKGIASGLLYLHEDWEKVVIHRDIKTSNVLLDNKMNGRLGDFGLARLHNHGTDAHTTHLAGTWGYIAPELARLGRATKATDLFAFGVFMLEVACGRHPIEVNNSGEPVLLTDWVIDAWESGSILKTVDPKLQDYVKEEADLVLKLGLLCSHSVHSARPCMRLVMQYLVKDVSLPDFQASFLSLTTRDEDFDQHMMHILSCASVATTMTGLSGGR